MTTLTSSRLRRIGSLVLAIAFLAIAATSIVVERWILLERNLHFALALIAIVTAILAHVIALRKTSSSDLIRSVHAAVGGAFFGAAVWWPIPESYVGGLLVTAILVKGLCVAVIISYFARSTASGTINDSAG